MEFILPTGEVIVKEAKGSFTYLSSRDAESHIILASNGILHEDLVDIINVTLRKYEKLKKDSRASLSSDWHEWKYLSIVFISLHLPIFWIFPTSTPALNIWDFQKCLYALYERF
jgi:hypothetical protein